MAWRYIATRPHGDGTETILEWDLPLSDVQVEQVLSGHGGITATLTPELEHLRVGGEQLFVPWHTCLYAEADGVIRGGGLLIEPEEDGPALSLDAPGHTCYLDGMPYTDVQLIERGDPLTVARHLWEHTQQRDGFNLGVNLAGASTSREMFLGDDTVDPSTTPQRVDPYVLAYWQTHDLTREYTALAEMAPFEWEIRHRWDGETIRHDLHHGYPRLGRRRDDLRFVIGENLHSEPAITTTAEEYASHVLVLGAGEGRSMMRAEESTTPTRLGRYAVITDRTITTPTAARARGRAELAALAGSPDVAELEVSQHPNAALGSYGVGDEILLQTRPGWQDVSELWVRILSITIRPDQPTTRLQVRRAEKVS